MPKSKRDKLLKKLPKSDGWFSPLVAVVLDGVKCLWGMDDVAAEIVLRNVDKKGSCDYYDYGLVELAPGSTDDDATLVCVIQTANGDFKVEMSGRVVMIEETDVYEEGDVLRFAALVVGKVAVNGRDVPVGAPINPMDDPEGPGVWAEPPSYELEREAQALEGMEEGPEMSKLERVVDSHHGTAMALYHGKFIKDEIQFVVGYIMACELELGTDGVEVATVGMLPVEGATDKDAKLRLKLDLDGVIVRDILVEGYMSDDEDYDTFVIQRMSRGGVVVPVDFDGPEGKGLREYHISADGSLDP